MSAISFCCLPFVGSSTKKIIDEMLYRGKIQWRRMAMWRGLILMGNAIDKKLTKVFWT